MERKQKVVKAIICIITALLIAGCFIVMAFMPKIFETNTASAETIESFPNSGPTTATEIGFAGIGTVGAETEVSQHQIVWYNKSHEKGPSRIAFYLKEQISNPYIVIYLNYISIRESGNGIGVEMVNTNGEIYDWGVIDTGYYVQASITDTIQLENVNRIRLRVSDTFHITQIFKMTINIWNEKGGEMVQQYKYESYANDLIFEAINHGTNQGYEEGLETGYEDGYNEGHKAGHNEGYQEGYDKGATANINPLLTFIAPVDAFLSTNIFGSISIGDVLSVILFVMVGTIFIKMFAGG